MSNTRKLLVAGTVFGILGMLYVIVSFAFGREYQCNFSEKSAMVEGQVTCCYNSELIPEPQGRATAYFEGVDYPYEIDIQTFQPSQSLKSNYRYAEVRAISEAKRDWRNKVLACYFLPAALIFFGCGAGLLFGKKTPMTPPPAPPMIPRQ